MATVKYSDLASMDLYEHVEYIAQDKPAAAYRWLESIESTCDLLASNPELGEQRRSKGHGPCRIFVVGNYVIFFRRSEAGIEIIRVLRGGRDLEQI